MSVSSPPPSPADTVLTFLESVGRRSEAEFYLRLFRQLPKQSFALVLADEAALASAPGSFAEQFRFLADLGLWAPIVLSGPSDSAPANQLETSLARRGLSTARFELGEPDLAAALTNALQGGQTPVVEVPEPTPFEPIGKLAQRLGTRKLVVIRRRGGLGPHAVSRVDLGPSHFLPTHPGGISVVNLRADHAALVASNVLDALDVQLLANVQTLLQSAGMPSTTLSITSPLSLLNELFTVKGAGTLIKLGSSIQRFESYQALDRERLSGLLQSSFKRTLHQHFFDSEPEAIYLEESYRGAAIVHPARSGAFLTKFAVDPLAQGEGIGQDLWRAMHKDTPKLYWRARPQNPILNWYKTVCDGFMHHEPWAIFWRGYTPREIPELVEDAILRPIDFNG